MIQQFPVQFHLTDGTEVFVTNQTGDVYEFHLTRLNSEKHNFLWHEDSNSIEESYETRFDRWQHEAISLFKQLKDTV
jgi:hypothetical protein